MATNTLNDLYKHNLAAVEVYKGVIKHISKEDVREKLNKFLTDHEGHLKDLEGLIKKETHEQPSDWRDLKGVLLEAYTSLRSLTGQSGAINALKTAEKVILKRYEEATSEPGISSKVSEIIRNHLHIEEKHKGYLDALDENLTLKEKDMEKDLGQKPYDKNTFDNANKRNNDMSQSDEKKNTDEQGHSGKEGERNKSQQSSNETGRGYSAEKDEGRVKAGQKSSEGGRGDPDKASPAAVERYLKGIHYPCSKEDLLGQAKSNNAPSDVMSVLDRFDDKQYNSTVEVAKEVGHVE